MSLRNRKFSLVLLLITTVCDALLVASRAIKHVKIRLDSGEELFVPRLVQPVSERDTAAAPENEKRPSPEPVVLHSPSPEPVVLEASSSGPQHFAMNEDDSSSEESSSDGEDFHTFASSLPDPPLSAFDAATTRLPADPSNSRLHPFQTLASGIIRGCSTADAEAGADEFEAALHLGLGRCRRCKMTLPLDKVEEHLEAGECLGEDAELGATGRCGHCKKVVPLDPESIEAHLAVCGKTTQEGGKEMKGGLLFGFGRCGGRKKT